MDAADAYIALGLLDSIPEGFRFHTDLAHGICQKVDRIPGIPRVGVDRISLIIMIHVFVKSQKVFNDRVLRVAAQELIHHHKFRTRHDASFGSIAGKLELIGNCFFEVCSVAGVVDNVKAIFVPISS